jgi:hypothetical protein
VSAISPAIGLSGVSPLRSQSSMYFSKKTLGHARRRALLLTMIDSNPESSESDCLVMPRIKMVSAFRSFLKDAGVNENGAPIALSLKEVSMALAKLGYGQQEIECVFKQIDKNGCDS